MEDPEGGMISESEEPEAVQQTVEVSTPRGKVHGVFYPADGARGAVVMVGGAGGGIHGPSGTYEELATLLQGEGATALRLEYRAPNYLDECVYDVLVAIAALGDRGVDRVVLVGWSFGGAVVISAGAESETVVGVATVASQTYGAGAVRELSPEKNLLLMHGTTDQVLPDRLSRDLYARAGEPKELVLYPGDGHGIERHRAEMLEKLREWSLDLLPNEEGARGA
jgi:dienelactone hydrolase